MSLVSIVKRTDDLPAEAKFFRSQVADDNNRCKFSSPMIGIFLNHSSTQTFEYSSACKKAQTTFDHYDRNRSGREKGTGLVRELSSLSRERIDRSHLSFGILTETSHGLIEQTTPFRIELQENGRRVEGVKRGAGRNVSLLQELRSTERFERERERYATERLELIRLARTPRRTESAVDARRLGTLEVIEAIVRRIRRAAFREFVGVEEQTELLVLAVRVVLAKREGLDPDEALVLGMQVIAVRQLFCRGFANAFADLEFERRELVRVPCPVLGTTGLVLPAHFAGVRRFRNGVDAAEMFFGSEAVETPGACATLCEFSPRVVPALFDVLHALLAEDFATILADCHSAILPVATKVALLSTQFTNHQRPVDTRRL